MDSNKLLISLNSITFTNMAEYKVRLDSFAYELLNQKNILISLIEKLEVDLPIYKDTCKYDNGLLALPVLSDERCDIKFNVINTRFKELPHQHRKGFYSLVLSGGYDQKLYSLHENNHRMFKDVQERLQLQYSYRVNIGDSYVISPEVIHDVFVQNETVSLFIRTPHFPKNDMPLNICLNSGNHWYHNEEYYRQHNATKQPYIPTEKMIADAFSKIKTIISNGFTRWIWR